MKFKTTAKVLKEAISKLIGIVPEKTQLPILTNILLSLEDNDLTLFANNIERNSMLMTLKVKGKQNGELCIPAKLTRDIIASFENDVTFTSNDGTVTIKADHSEFEIPTESPADYPRTADLEKMKTVILTQDNIKKFSKVIHSAGKDELKPHMNCILLEFDKDTLNYVATDSFRMTTIADIITSEVSEPVNLLLNLETADLISKYGNTKDTSLEFSYNSNYVKVEFNNMVIIGRLVDEVFPPYKTVVPQEFNASIEFNKAELQKAVNRSTITGSRIVLIKFIGQLPDEATITSFNQDQNLKYEQTVTYKTNATPDEIRLSSQALIEALNVTEPEKDTINVNVQAKKMATIQGKAGHTEFIMFKVPKEKAKKEKKPEQKAETTPETKVEEKAPETPTAETKPETKPKKKGKTATKKAA